MDTLLTTTSCLLSTGFEHACTVCANYDDSCPRFPQGYDWDRCPITGCIDACAKDCDAFWTGQLWCAPAPNLPPAAAGTRSHTRTLHSSEPMLVYPDTPACRVCELRGTKQCGGLEDCRPAMGMWLDKYFARDAPAAADLPWVGAEEQEVVVPHPAPEPPRMCPTTGREMQLFYGTNPTCERCSNVSCPFSEWSPCESCYQVELDCPCPMKVRWTEERRAALAPIEAELALTYEGSEAAFPVAACGRKRCDLCSAYDCGVVKEDCTTYIDTYGASVDPLQEVPADWVWTLEHQCPIKGRKFTSRCVNGCPFPATYASEENLWFAPCM